jgi:hypothetical protein
MTGSDARPSSQALRPNHPNTRRQHPVSTTRNLTTRTLRLCPNRAMRVDKSTQTTRGLRIHASRHDYSPMLRPVAASAKTHPDS